MASPEPHESGAITARDEFAQNDPTGRPNSDGLTTEGVSGGSFDISSRLAPNFDRGRTNASLRRMTDWPEPPGSIPFPASPRSGDSLAHDLNRASNHPVPLTRKESRREN